MLCDADNCSELTKTEEQRAELASALLKPYDEAKEDSADAAVAPAAEGARTHALLWVVSDDEDEASAVHRRAADEAAWRHAGRPLPARMLRASMIGSC